jgi:hypothetical protein
VSDETGGYSYFEGLTNPVNVSPFLKDVQYRLDHQYRVTIQPVAQKGFQPVKLRAEVAGLKVSGPSEIWVE